MNTIIVKLKPGIWLISVDSSPVCLKTVKSF